MAGAMMAAGVPHAVTRRGARHLLVLLHGIYGLPEDMAGCIGRLPPTVRAVSLPGRLAMGERRAWARPGVSDPAGIRASAAAVARWVAAARGFSTIGLVGYSQGAAVAVELLRTRPGTFDYTVLLSGLLPAAGSPLDARLAGIRPPVFCGRGMADDVVPQSSSRQLEAWLRRNTGARLRRYPGLGHGMGARELDDAAGFIGGMTGGGR